MLNLEQHQLIIDVQFFRWPYECQVLPEKVKHIKSVPSIPEVFYEPTGKEPMPRPLGEEHGTVCFEYMPTSPVNYFR